MLLKEILEEEISKLKDGHPKLLRNLKAEVRALEDAGGADAALQPGDLAPEFKLQDQNDRTIDSKRILKRHPLIVVFYHGDWSSLCMLTLKSMQDHVSSFEQKDAQIVAICPQSNTQAAAEKSGAHFSLLADPGNKVAKKFRLVYMMDTELPGSSSPWPLPMAATYILDTDGIVTYASVSCNPLLRAEPLDILGVIPRPIRLSNRAIPAIPRPVRHTSRNLSIDQGCHNYDLPDLPAKKELFCQIVFPLVRDRTYRCKTYPKIFVGAGACSFSLWKSCLSRSHFVLFLIYYNPIQRLSMPWSMLILPRLVEKLCFLEEWSPRNFLYSNMSSTNIRFAMIICFISLMILRPLHLV